MSGPGLKRMKDATPAGFCAFCLDPLPPPAPGANPKLFCCGDPACRTAYQRTYRRDRRGSGTQLLTQR